MASFLFLATAGAGGDLQPLVAAAFGLRDRGHETTFVGDASVERSLHGSSFQIHVLPPELDLGPRLVGAIRDAMIAAGGDAAAAGPIVQERMSGWARDMVAPVADAIEQRRPDGLATSLFGVEVLDAVPTNRPWAVVNSTFAIGPAPSRPFAEDFGPRAVPLIARYASLLESANLVLHATDPAFDFGGRSLPATHHYVGPLGIWEPAAEPLAVLEEPGDPWVLVTISSQLQDDIALADAALSALAKRPVRVMLTLGPGHERSELAAVPANANVESLVSHSAVLERGVMLLSHAGHGSVMKALWNGKPMVLVPWGRDQPGVAARADALGVAAVVPPEQASEEVLSSAIDRVIGDESMRARAAEHGSRLKATDPRSTVAALLETLL